MRHNVKSKKLSRTKEHRLALRYNLLRSLAIHKKITTTLAKVKFALPFIEKVISIAKSEDLTSYRRILAYMRNDEKTSKIIQSIGQDMKNRNGGYVEQIKLNFRKGDGASQVLLRFVEN